MNFGAEQLRLHDARSQKSGFLAVALGTLTFAAVTCNGLTATQTTEAVWPTNGWQTSMPEEQGMDSAELAKVVEFGASRFTSSDSTTPVSRLDSLLVVRHGKIVTEAYYAPYAAGILHQVNSVTKAVISTLIGIACKDGLLDSLPAYAVEAYASSTTKSDPTFSGPIGLDGLYRKGEITRHGFAGWLEGVPRINGLKGTWQDDRTFVIDRLAIGLAQSPERWTLAFEGSSLKLRVKFSDGPKIAVQGEAEDKQ
jgi:hypothetical protein